jgi:uncharacterized repeat protein (TIGR01451 family)
VPSVKDGKGSLQLIGPITETDRNQIIGIVLEEGDFSRGNDFGEIMGSIGNQIWFDADGDGWFNNGESGIANVEVSLFADINNDGIYDPSTHTTPIATTLTNGLGQYYFDDLPIGKYIVVVTDSGNVLGAANLVATETPAGCVAQDNCHKNPNGYAIEITSENLSNVTADFGYVEGPDLPAALKIVKTANQTKAKVGDNVTYTITASNVTNGSGPVTGVSIVDTLPAGIDYVSSSPAGSYDPPTRTVTWTGNTIAYGAPVVFTVIGTINDSVAVGDTITNLAEITGQSEACEQTASSCGDEVDITVQPPGWPFVPKPPNTGYEILKTVAIAGGASIVAAGAVALVVSRQARKRHNPQRSNNGLKF